MRKRLLSLALAATVLAAQPAAADYAAGWAALQAGDFATALAEWQPLAERGHVKAQAGLGFMYLNGFGVAEDTEAAFVWFVEAANGGDADAMFVIANLYFFGEGGRPQNFSAAAEWYAVAEETLPGGRAQVQAEVYGKLATQLVIIADDAEGGNPTAQVVLANRYFAEGDLQDIAKAAFWYRRAADQGHQVAQFKLGEIYQFGFGVEADGNESHFWYALSAAQGHVEALRRRDLFVDSLDPDVLAASLARIQAWTPRPEG